MKTRLRDRFRGKKFHQLMGKIIAYVVLSAGSIIFLIPFFWMISTAFKEAADVYFFPPQWIPKPIVWSNIPEALTILPFATYLKNTLIIVTFAVTGTVLSAALVAYGFARLRFPGRDILFFILLCTLLLPAQVTMIPLFILFKHLRWIDTFKPLIIPAWLGGGAFNVFLLRQFFMTIPLDLDDAARIDGCGTFQIFLRIILPLCKPALTVLTVFSFMMHWNDFLMPLIYLNTPKKYTVALGLAMFKGSYGADTQLLMAATFIFALPCIAIFFFAQKQLIQGITLTGIKG